MRQNEYMEDSAAQSLLWRIATPSKNADMYSAEKNDGSSQHWEWRLRQWCPWWHWSWIIINIIGACLKASACFRTEVKGRKVIDQSFMERFEIAIPEAGADISIEPH